MRHGLSFLVFALSVGCFSSAGSTAPDADVPDSGAGEATAVATGTWSDGTHIDSSIVVQGGTTVTIAPGAVVTIAPGATIRVEGVLTASSAQGPHAKLTGNGWGGIQVVGYGVLALDGVDLDGANVALDMKAEAPCKYDDGMISGSQTPFSIEGGGNISTTHSAVTAPRGISTIAGAFTASYLDYDANDHGAIVTTSPDALVHIEDSTIHNSGPMGSSSAPDLLTANGASTFHVAYTDISGAHCGFHFEGVDTIEIDHVTVHGVTNGADVWGSSSTGTRTITSSNFEQLSENFDESNANGAVSVSGCYMTGTNKLAQSTAITITSPASQAIVDAKPR